MGSGGRRAAVFSASNKKRRGAVLVPRHAFKAEGPRRRGGGGFCAAGAGAPLSLAFGFRMLTFSPLLARGGAQIASRGLPAALPLPISGAQSVLTADREEILARQAMFADLLALPRLSELLEDLSGRCASLAALARDLRESGERESEAIFYSLREFLLFTDAVRSLAAGARELSGESSPSSPRWREFLARARDIEESEEFQDLLSFLESLDEGLRGLRSLTVGVNLDASLRVEEVALVSFHAGRFLPPGRSAARGARKKSRREGNTRTEETYPCLAAVGMGGRGLSTDDARVLGSALLRAANDAVRANLKKLRSSVGESVRDCLSSLLALSEDVTFFLAAREYLSNLREAGLPLVFPEVAEDGEARIERLYPAQLCGKLAASDIVPSDILFDEKHRVYLLTGPNSGGKSVFLRGLCAAQLLAQMGMPIPAQRARVCLYDRIEAMFIEGGGRDGRLAEEAARLRAALDSFHGQRRVLFLLDETFSGTSVYDALYLAQALVTYLAKAGLHAVYITHLHELALKMDAAAGGEPPPGVALIYAKVAGGRRGYEILPGRGEEKSSLARDIIEAAGLGFLLE